MASTNNKEIVVSRSTANSKVLCVQSNCRVQAAALSCMLDDDKFCDVVLFGVPPSGGPASSLRPIRAHKNILAYASKHFYELFTGENYTDSHQSEYNIENVSHDTLRLIIEFIYTDKLSTSELNATDMIRHILTGAKYLIMPELAEACEIFLGGEAELNLDNCISLWCFARKYSCFDLMHATSTFIAKNIRDMPKNAPFLNMPFDDCAKLLLSEAFIAADVDLRCVAAIAWLNCDATADRACHVHDVLNMIPFTPGSVSTGTVIKASRSQLLRKIASDVVLDLTVGIFERIEQDRPVLDANSWSSSQSWYVIGGSTCPNMFLSYDVDRRLWSNLPSLSAERKSLGACAAGNQLIVIGGVMNGTCSADIDVFDLKTKSWSKSNATLQTSRRNFAVCSDGLFAYVIGGYDGVKHVTSFERYDIQSNEVCTLSSMNSKRWSPGAVFDSKSNSIYVAGDNGSYTGAGVETYDILANKWSQVGSTTISRCGLGGALSGEELYCVGGYCNTGDCNNVEVFNVRTSQTRIAPNLLENRSYCCATTINNGNVICVLGGSLATVECYDVREGRWTTGVIVPDMPEKNCYFGFAAV